MRFKGFKVWTLGVMLVALAAGSPEGGPAALAENGASPVAGTEVAGVPALLITELVPDTANYAGYDAFEFIEIFNAGETPADLTGYRLLSDKWNRVIEPPLTIQPREAAVVWTRRAEIAPITREGFNSYYFLSYKSKHLEDGRLAVIDDVGGLVNSGTRTVILQNASGAEVVRAVYTGADVAEGKSVTFRYPDAGSGEMKVLASRQSPTPGWITEGQAGPRGNSGGQPPAPPAELKVTAGAGTASLSWDTSASPDVEKYNIYKNGNLEFTVAADRNQFQVYGLTGNVSYRFEVTAVDRYDQESAMSASASVVPTHQLITQSERVQNPYDPKYQMLWDISNDGPVIPGLEQDLVPQGLGYYKKEDWILAVYYLDDGRPGTLSVIHRTTGRLVKSVVLMNPDGTPYTGHAGGVAVSPRYVWIASEKYLYRMSLQDLVRARNNAEISFQKRIPVPVQASYNYYADGMLWVGEFYEKNSYPTDPGHHMTNRVGETQFAWMAGYQLDPATGDIAAEDWTPGSATPAIPSQILSTTGKVQGAVVRSDGVILSTSYGRGNDSVLYWYANPLAEAPHASALIEGREVPVRFLDSLAEKPQNARLTVVPMTEGIVDVDGELYVQLESGAAKYRYTTTYTMDRMVAIRLKCWERYGVEAGPPPGRGPGEPPPPVKEKCIWYRPPA